MQIPEELKTLYCHWEKHTEFQPDPSQVHPRFDPLLNEIEVFITERMKIWEKKSRGGNPPFTNDEVLQKYRFCNVYRELDRQTIEIHKMLQPLKGDFKLWLLNLAFNRFIANPKTVQEIGLLNFRAKNNDAVMERLLEKPSPRYGNAYVFPISAIMNHEYNTRETLFTQYLPLIIPKIAPIVLKMKNASIMEALEQIIPVFGFNYRFHWTEILIDVAYQFPDLINLFDDFYVGPGAKPSTRLFTIKFGDNVPKYLTNVKFNNFPYLEYEGKKVWLSAENWEGIACELRKYKNLSAGSGRKRFFK